MKSDFNKTSFKNFNTAKGAVNHEGTELFEVGG